MTGEAPRIPSCNEIVPHYCADNSARLDEACHDLGYPPGHPILFQLDDRVCSCVCGERDGERPTVSELREQLGRWLRIGRPVSREVLVAALTDPAYRRRIGFARRTPEALEWLLARPPALPASAEQMLPASVEQVLPASTAELVDGGLEDELAQSAGALARRAGGSLVKFFASGFATVDDETRERRWAACQACPHLADPPSSGVHRVTRIVRPEAKVCGLCGCLAAAKVRAAHEHCPGVDPLDPGRTRWGEPRRPVRAPEQTGGAPLARVDGFDRRPTLSGAALPD
jgi:hypothetical protein